MKKIKITQMDILQEYFHVYWVDNQQKWNEFFEKYKKRNILITALALGLSLTKILKISCKLLAKKIIS